MCNVTRGEKQCGGPECYEAADQCDFKADCSDGVDESKCAACDFEEFKLCGYKHDESAEVLIICQLSANYQLIIC